MKLGWKGQFGRRLSFIQARNCVAVAFVVGLLLSLIQISFDYYREQSALQVFGSQVLEASKYSAAEAAFDLDVAAAQEVVRGVLGYDAVISANILTEDGLPLVQQSKEVLIRHEDDLRVLFLGKSQPFVTPLLLETGETVGELAIVVDPVLAAQGFVDRSLLVIFGGIIRNVLFAFILIVVFHHTITKKLVSISSRLADVDIKNPLENRIPEENFANSGELSELAHTVNEMLDIISNDAKELIYRANHDPLTGLANRSCFEKRLDSALASSRRERAEHVLCYLDLDQFKVVNDTCGHLAGDALLHQVATVLGKDLRRGDVLARLGGDEFGILMEHCDLKSAIHIAETLCDNVECSRFEWDGKRFSIGVSIGVVQVTHEETSTIGLLKKADLACFAVKAAGGHGIRLYHEESEDVAKLNTEMHWVSKISEALEENRFCLFAQPIVPVGLSEHPGMHYEVLLRLLDEQGNIVPPGEFLPSAEQYGIINKVDRWVVESLFRFLSEHQEYLQRLWLCSVNLSGPSLAAPGFGNFILEQFERYHIPPHKICFEITETAAIANLTLAADFISTLRGKGCRFALDDFGTGLSSFAYLKNLPVDYLKIDGVFIKGIKVDPVDFAMVKSIHEVARVMGMQTIAEFVDDEGVYQKLEEVGIDFAQGYGIGKPVAIEKISSPSSQLTGFSAQVISLSDYK